MDTSTSTGMGNIESAASGADTAAAGAENTAGMGLGTSAGPADTAQAQADGAAPAAQQGEDREGTGAPEGTAKPWHTDENAMAAQRRRDAQARQRERMFREMTDGIVDPRTGRPFSTEADWQAWKQDMTIRAKAAEAGVEPEKAQQIVEGMRQTLLESDPEVTEMRRQLAEARQAQDAQTFERDLRAIKKAYPDEKAKNVAELGKEFLAIMASGQVDAVTAYEAVRAHQNRSAPKPPSTGAIGGTAGRKDGYYTRDEVAAMTPQQVHEKFDDIKKSMRLWK